MKEKIKDGEKFALDKSLMQGDGLHYGVKGHLIICNAVSTNLGFGTNYSADYEDEGTATEVFENLME